jgi:tetratricopeptide (TPR) repeat protein
MEKALKPNVKGIKQGHSTEETCKMIRASLASEWVLFIRPDERLKVLSKKNLRKALKKKNVDAYALITKHAMEYGLIEPFQLMTKLDQFKDIQNKEYVTEFQIRLVKRDFIEAGLNLMLHDRVEGLEQAHNQILEGLAVEPIIRDEEDDSPSSEDHDLLCLRGERRFDPSKEDELVVLSELFTGFRVFHTGYVDSFIDGAKRGFGTYKMFIPLLRFLCDQGLFEDARRLYEAWIENRNETEIINTSMVGGLIYASLLETDRAIRCFEKVADSGEGSMVFSNLAKLHLIKGDREKAVEYLNKADDLVGDPDMKKLVLSIITRPKWRPMTLSLCMIARDEETSIEKALDSVNEIVDEIIVVDTGSSDRTREIVEGFGGRVVEMAWEDDFSAARNRSLREANCDYILYMDADEYIDPRHRFQLALLKNLIPEDRNLAFTTKVEPPKKEKALSVQAYLDRLKEYEIVEYQVRFFPRHEGVRFDGAIFESVTESLKRLGIDMAPNDLLRITHSADSRVHRDERKASVAVKSYGSIHESEKLIEGGLLFLRLGDLKEAAVWFERADSINPQLATKIAMLFAGQNMPDSAKALIKKAMKEAPHAPDLALTLAGLYHKEEQHQKVLAVLDEHIEMSQTYLEPEDLATALFYKGIALLETGETVSGIDQLAKIRDVSPEDRRANIAGIYAFTRVNQWEEALRWTVQMVEEEGVETVSMVDGFVDVGKIFVDLYRHYSGNGEREAAELCHRIIEDIIKTKISTKEDIKRMSESVEHLAAAVQ